MREHPSTRAMAARAVPLSTTRTGYMKHAHREQTLSRQPPVMKTRRSACQLQQQRKEEAAIAGRREVVRRARQPSHRVRVPAQWGSARAALRAAHAALRHAHAALRHAHAALRRPDCSTAAQLVPQCCGDSQHCGSPPAAVRRAHVAAATDFGRTAATLG